MAAESIVRGSSQRVVNYLQLLFIFRKINLCFVFRWFKLRIEAENYYSIPPPNIAKHCARGRDNYKTIDATLAKLPSNFLDRYNRVPVPSKLLPTCKSGYTHLPGC